MERYIVERITQGTVLLEKEDLSHIEVKLTEFNFEIFEGDILLFDGKGYSKDENSQRVRKEKLLTLQEKLSKRNKK